MHLDITNRWLSVLEIAQYLGVSKETIYRWLDVNRIPALKVGKQWKFKVNEVDEWIRTGGAADESCENKKRKIKKEM